MRSPATLIVASLCLPFACSPDIEAPATFMAVVAEFDPDAAGTAGAPRIPLPNDLLRDARTGRLVIPHAPGASAARRAFDDYLGTLDGFPPTTQVRAGFSAPLDGASVTPSTAERDGAVFVYDATTMQPLVGDAAHDGAGDYDLQLADDDKVLVIRPHLSLAGARSQQPWRLGHSYVVLLFGGDDRYGLHARDGDMQVAASPTMFLLRSANPLLTTCAPADPDLAGERCLCPLEAGAFDARCLPAAGLTLERARSLEPRRRELRQLLVSLLPLAGVDKRAANMVLAWRFTIAHGPFATYDPSLARFPFPSDVFLDARTGKVNLGPTIDPKSPLAPVYAQLDQLDGFSTTGDIRAPIEVAGDTGNAPPGGAVAKTSVLLINLTEPSKQPDYGVRPETINGGQDYDGLLLIHPNRALRPDLSHYLAVITTDVTDGKGRPLRSSPLMQLLKSDAPLVDADKRSTLPGLIDDAQAQQLEALRLSWLGAGLWDTLNRPPLSIPKERVALLWTFRTQSMTQALRDLAAYPAAKTLPTEVTLLDAQVTAGALGPDVGQVVWGRLRTHLALDAGGTLDPAGGRDLDVPFVMTVPVSAAPAGVAVVQHGLGGWRGDVRAIAQALARAGWAAIAIDLHRHGARAACARDADCDGGGTCGRATGVCSTRLAVKCSTDDQCEKGGTCDGKAGTCSNALAPSSTLCMTHDEAGKPVTECRPAAGGASYLSLETPFALRDNLRQAVLDLSQVQRVISGDAPGSLRAQLAALPAPIALPAVNAAHTAVVGQSVGAMAAALFLSVSPQPELGVLNVPGARVVDLMISSEPLRASLGPLLRAQGIAADTPEYYRLLDTWRWIVDPGDPVNFARHLVSEPLGMNPPRRVIVQEAGKDGVIASGFTEALAAEIGLPFSGGKPAQAGGGGGLVSTFFPKASHGFLLGAEPSTAPGQTQAVTWIVSGGKQLAPPGP